MLRIDDQRARIRDVKPGADPAFLQASAGIRFEAETREQGYIWIERVLCQQQYPQQGRAARGLLRRYVEKMTGFSRAQVTRFIHRYQARGTVQPVRYQRHRFPQRYTRIDVELLAAVDEAHETLSGPATRRILQREYQHYGKPEYQRLASISVAHLYNLRQQPRYRERRLSYTKTKPTVVTIGERRCPDPQGQPGYLRVETVHQGDQSGDKGVTVETTDVAGKPTLRYIVHDEEEDRLYSFLGTVDLNIKLRKSDISKIVEVQYVGQDPYPRASAGSGRKTFRIGDEFGADAETGLTHPGVLQ